MARIGDNFGGFRDGIAHEILTAVLMTTSPYADISQERKDEYNKYLKEMSKDHQDIIDSAQLYAAALFGKDYHFTTPVEINGSTTLLTRMFSNKTLQAMAGLDFTEPKNLNIVELPFEKFKTLPYTVYSDMTEKQTAEIEEFVESYFRAVLESDKININALNELISWHVFVPHIYSHFVEVFADKIAEASPYIRAIVTESKENAMIRLYNIESLRDWKFNHPEEFDEKDLEDMDMTLENRTDTKIEVKPTEVHAYKGMEQDLVQIFQTVNRYYQLNKENDISKEDLEILKQSVVQIKDQAVFVFNRFFQELGNLEANLNSWTDASNLADMTKFIEQMRNEMNDLQV